jgi:hypothetical protein
MQRNRPHLTTKDAPLLVVTLMLCGTLLTPLSPYVGPWMLEARMQAGEEISFGALALAAVLVVVPFGIAVAMLLTRVRNRYMISGLLLLGWFAVMFLPGVHPGELAALAGTVMLLLTACVLLFMPDEDAHPAAPLWPRRLRWMLLGGLPGCVVQGLTKYAAADISAIPFFWVAPLALWAIAWCLAFAPVALRRLTLIAHSVLLALVLLQVFAGERLNIMVAISPHLLSCFVICWGCQGDAVKEALALGRVQEFLLCMIGGFLLCSFLYLCLPALVVPHSWGFIEYPLVLVACLVIRLRPVPPAKARQDQGTFDFPRHSEMVYHEPPQ